MRPSSAFGDRRGQIALESVGLIRTEPMDDGWRIVSCDDDALSRPRGRMAAFGSPAPGVRGAACLKYKVADLLTALERLGKRAAKLVGFGP